MNLKPLSITKINSNYTKIKYAKQNKKLEVHRTRHLDNKVVPKTYLLIIGKRCKIFLLNMNIANVRS